MANDENPKGFDGWQKEDWARFVSGFSSDHGLVKERHFSGSFSGYETAALIAVVSEILPLPNFVATYGHSALDMLGKWREDLSIGIKDPKLDRWGVNDPGNIDGIMAQVVGMLT
jgi:hypothetical protein